MKSVLRRNLGLKLVSLILAYLAWTVVVGRPQLRNEFDVSIFFKNDSSTIVVGHSPHTFKAVISGDESIFRSGVLDRLSAQIDVSGLAPGSQEISVRRSDLTNLPRGALVEKLEGAITVEIAERLSRPLDVIVNPAGSPPETHRLGLLLQALPDRVIVSGPLSIVSTLDAARTEPVDISGKRQTFSREVRIQPIDRNVTIKPESVRVSIGIVERSATGKVELLVEGLPAGWRAEPDRVVVSVTAAASALQRVLGATKARVSSVLPEPGSSAQIAVVFPSLPGDVIALIESSSASPQSVVLTPANAPR